MSKIKNELNSKLERILSIYTLAKEAYLYTEYFHNPETKDEKNLIHDSPHSSHLRFIMHLMFRALITEVSKLFKNSGQEKYSLIAFVHSLAPSGHFRKFGISPQYLQRWHQCIEENQQIISKVLILRDKVYAHADDPLKSYSDVDLTFKNVKTLLDLAAEILKEIHKVVLDIDLRLDSAIFDSERFRVLTLLAKAEKQRVDEIYMKYFSKLKSDGA